LHNVKSRLIHLHTLTYGSRGLIRSMLQKDPTLKLLFQQSPETLQSTYHLSPQKASQLFRHLHSTESWDKTRVFMEQYSPITFYDLEYPPQLLSIPDAPPVIYIAGHKDLLKRSPSISVVGTRHCTIQAKRKMNHILTPLIKEEWNIVSGMAKGIDTFAHQLAIEERGTTIGVLAFGFEHCYPKHNRELMKELARNHLLISEYPPYISPQKWHFPERNRIISGLSYGTLVVEAKERSGSLITADQALEQGREVYAIPDSILDNRSKGCHTLIQMGAKLVQNTYDLSEDWEELRANWCRFMSENPSS